MIYLYTALGASLIIPLLSLAQALVNVGVFQAELTSERAFQLDIERKAISKFETNLIEAMDSKPKRLEANDSEPVTGPTKAHQDCDLLADSPESAPLGIENIEWSGKTPECTALVFVKVSDSDQRILRINFSYVPASGAKEGLPEFGHSKPYTDLNRSLRLLDSCWISPSDQASCI